MGANDLTILATDDKPDNLTALKAVVADAFPHALFLAAPDGGRGLDLAQAEDPDVVALDIVMRGMDGFEVCRRLNGDERTRDLGEAVRYPSQEADFDRPGTAERTA